jgi:hypothetical protein
MKTPKHTEWEGLVDPTWFGLIAGYLRSPRSPIEYLVHVKDRDRLSEVADRIDGDLAHGDGQPHRLTPSVEELVGEGAVKVSSRRPVEDIDPDATVDPERIRSSASCDVLYLPPYYVLHTPGLFEGELTVKEQPTQAQSARSDEASMVTTARRRKDAGHEHDQ